EEEGVYYAIDLGRINFRMLWVQLAEKSGIISLEFVEASIAPHLMVGTSQLSVRIVLDTKRCLCYVHFHPHSAPIQLITEVILLSWD
ncbi:hexokinase-1-like protein, partial [Tanacetum coccineum]